NKIMKLYLLLMTAFFGVNGFMIAFTTSVLYVAQIKALKTPYLWPFIPFNARAFLLFILRVPIPFVNSRPDIVQFGIASCRVLEFRRVLFRSNKIMKLYLLLMTAFFGVNGFMIAFTTSVLYLAQIKALKTPYLWPFIPFNARAFLRFILRVPIPFVNSRPDIV